MSSYCPRLLPVFYKLPASLLLKRGRSRGRGRGRGRGRNLLEMFFPERSGSAKTYSKPTRSKFFLPTKDFKLSLNRTLGIAIFFSL